ncbi:hypothetical protein CVD28_18680 [Bacillus sp. M6-12]|nr:hypothetical protein CVD28_18680 [Bacillus sp. M6-12]
MPIFSIIKKLKKITSEEFLHEIAVIRSQTLEGYYKVTYKKIKMEPNRKDIKSIVFWFLEDNALSLKDALPESELGRTVS